MARGDNGTGGRGRRTGGGRSLSGSLRVLMAALLVLLLGSAVAHALQNSASGSAGGVSLDSSRATVTLQRVAAAATQGRVLDLVKGASKREALVGDVITYVIHVRNRVTRDVTLARVADHLPPNFNYVKGSTLVNGARGADPEGNRTLVFDLGTVPALVDRNGNGQADQGEPGFVSISYQLRVGAGAIPGDYVNTAVARDVCDSCYISNESDARVTISLDPLFDLGTIIGKVFEDANRDGIQDRGEKGVGNVMVALDDGTYVLTDEYGRYHFPAVRPGQRLLKINRHTLPPGTEITTRESLVVSVTSGLLAKANFGVLPRYDVETIGRAGEAGIGISSRETKQPIDVRGDVQTPTLIINGDRAPLPTSDAPLARPDDDVIEVSYNRKEAAAEFAPEIDSRVPVKRWALTILTTEGEKVHILGGTEAPPNPIRWNGTLADGELIPGGKPYRYQLEVEYDDGTRSTSPLRSFGVSYSTAISLNLTGGAFRSGSADLTTQARRILKETAQVMKRSTRERVIIEGHTDSVGGVEYNLDLSKRRAEAAASYFIDEEKIPRERFDVRWFGKARHLASNETPEGRELNRRVEIRGEFSEVNRSKPEPPVSVPPAASVNGAKVPVDADGRFATTVTDEKARAVEVQLNNDRGRSVTASVPLPTLEILEPRGEMQLAVGKNGNGYEVQLGGADGKGGTVVRCRLSGRTEAGNAVEFDGKPVPVAEGGTFATDLQLHGGENFFPMMVRNGAGFTRISSLMVTVSDRDGEGKVILTVRPIPNLTVKLPPKGVVLTSKQLTIAGQADPGTTVRVASRKVDLAKDGSFRLDVTLQKGTNIIRIDAIDKDENMGTIEREVEVNDTQLFFMALADGKVGQMQTKGYLKGAGESGASRFYQEGRIAYYLKGVIAGKYLVTSAFDSGTREFGKLFKDLNKGESDRLLTNLDPDKLYPVYGDSSTIVYDAQSQGKFYLALDSDEFHLLVGNYPVNLADTELAAYQRTLYGARASYESRERTSYGQPVTKAEVFGAQLRQVHIRDELRATGGSLYYLSHKELIEGSEQVTLVIRDKNTGLQLSRVPQQQNVDYTVRYDQGRILFNRTIASVAQDMQLVNQALLAGNPVHIQVDYEAKLDSFEKNAYGARVRQQVGDHVAVGGTVIRDESQGGKYELNAADTEIRLGKNTRIVGEYATSSGSGANGFFSEDGGLSYRQSDEGGTRKGGAWKVSVESDVGEWVDKPDRLRMTGYVKRLEPGFSSSGNALEEGTTKYGATASLKATKADTVQARFDREERDGSTPAARGESTVGTVQYTHDHGRWQASAEIQSRETKSGDAAATRSDVAAVRVKGEVVKNLTGSVTQQVTITGPRNDQTTVAAEYQVLPQLGLTASGTYGNLGTAAQGGAVLTLDKSRLYLMERLADDRAGQSLVTVVGGERSLGRGSRLYSEYQWERTDTGNRTLSVLGAQKEWEPREGLRVLVSGEHGDIIGSSRKSSRLVLGVGASYSRGGFTFTTREEMRSESGDPSRLQLLTSNQLELKLSPDFTLVGRYRYSRTKDRNLDRVEARFEDRSIGLAYRPVEHDRFNALARYTRLSELRPLSPTVTEADDTTSDVISGEWSLELHRYVEWAAKEALRISRSRSGGAPETSTRTLLSLHRLNFHLHRRVDLGAEYRILSMNARGGSRKGWLTELTWEALDHLRLGVGYNFTDFSDDEFAENDYSMYGWFFRVQGKY